MMFQHNFELVSFYIIVFFIVCITSYILTHIDNLILSTDFQGKTS